MNTKLKVEGIQSGYGEIQVLRGIEMLCGEAQITALVGSNGAGKSTLLRTLAGILPTATGRILYGGVEIQTLPSHERVARGIIMVPEGRLVFPDLSVEENLRTGAVNVRARDVWSRTIACQKSCCWMSQRWVWRHRLQLRFLMLFRDLPKVISLS